MSYGLSVYNSASFVQIDSTYLNYCELMRGSVTISGTGFREIFLGASYTAPLIAIRTTSGNGLASTYTVGSSPSSFAVIIENISTNTTTVEYVVFVESGAIASSGNFGLLVRNGYGSEVFNSNKKALRINSVVSANLGTQGVHSSTYNPKFITTIPHSMGNPFVLAENPTSRRGVLLVGGSPAAWLITAIKTGNNELIYSYNYRQINPMVGPDWVHVHENVVQRFAFLNN